MRIAFIAHDYNRQTGNARYVAELATRFQHEHEVHVFANTFQEAPGHHIRYHHVPALRFNALASVLSFIIPSSWLVWRNGPFAIVHAQGFCGLSQNLVTAHITQAGWFNAIDRLGLKQSWKKRIFRFVVSRLERTVFRPSAAKAFIAVSNGVMADLERYHGLKKNVFAIHHGIDLETFHPRNIALFRHQIRKKMNVDPDQFLLLYVGDWQKAGHTLLPMLELLPNVTLAVVTRSDHNSIENEARLRGLIGRLKLLPHSREIHKFYATADVFVFPSFYDTFGMVVAEAMATGLPCIVSRDAGASEWITHERSGFVIENSVDAGAFADCVSALVSDAQLTKRIGVNARERCLLHSWEKVAEQTMQVYQCIVGIP